MTDEAKIYPRIGGAFAGHGTVNHSIKEYVRGSFWHTNTVENYFSILKRGINGTYQAVSEKHLKRYLGEFDFRYNTRDVSDFERASLATKGAEGKRLTYRRTGIGRNSGGRLPHERFRQALRVALLETTLLENRDPILTAESLRFRR